MSADCKHAVPVLDPACDEEPQSAAVLDFCAVRLERLTEQIVAQLRQHGGAVTRHTVDVGDVAQWRRAARRAGRVLDLPVRTGVAPDRSKVWVITERLAGSHHRRS